MQLWRMPLMPWMIFVNIKERLMFFREYDCCIFRFLLQIIQNIFLLIIKISQIYQNNQIIYIKKIKYHFSYLKHNLSTTILLFYSSWILTFRVYQFRSSNLLNLLFLFLFLYLLLFFFITYISLSLYCHTHLYHFTLLHL
jgi:hypothetical protein